VSVTLDIDDETLAALPFGAGELERHMRIELACRYYAKGWITLGQAAKFADLNSLDMGIALGERGIPRNYGLTEILEDVANAGR
jgi:predicted HTH domain antitoxin